MNTCNKNSVTKSPQEHTIRNGRKHIGTYEPKRQETYFWTSALSENSDLLAERALLEQ